MERGSKYDNVYHFGPFYLDAAERVLLRGGRVVPLPLKALNTLLVLVRNSNHLVEKEVMMNEVWPNEFVEEGNLAQHICMLRKALGDSTRSPKYIETVPRRGYRFLHNIEEANGAAVEEESGRKHDTEPYVRPLRSLAVVPFVSIGGHGSQELADKLTQNIIDGLSQIPHLYVAPRTCVSHHKGRAVDARQVGYEQGVQNVAFGTVQLRHGSTKIRTEMIDVNCGWHIYARTHSCEARNYLEVQATIVRALSAILQSRSREDHEANYEETYGGP